jgi:hypothetical protein
MLGMVTEQQPNQLWWIRHMHCGAHLYISLCGMEEKCIIALSLTTTTRASAFYRLLSLAPVCCAAVALLVVHHSIGSLHCFPDSPPVAQALPAACCDLLKSSFQTVPALPQLDHPLLFHALHMCWGQKFSSSLLPSIGISQHSNLFGIPSAVIRSPSPCSPPSTTLL